MPKLQDRTNRRHTISRNLYQLQSALNQSTICTKWCFATSMKEADAYFKQSGIKGNYFLVDKTNNKMIIVNY